MQGNLVFANGRSIDGHSGLLSKLELLSGITREMVSSRSIVDRQFHVRPKKAKIANKSAFNATSTPMVAAIKLIIQFLIVARHYLRLIITQVKGFSAKIENLRFI